MYTKFKRKQIHNNKVIIVREEVRIIEGNKIKDKKI